MWKDFFYFSKRERNGIVILIVFILGVGLGKILFSRMENAASSNVIEAQDTTEFQTRSNEAPHYQSKPAYHKNSSRQYSTSSRSYKGNSATTKSHFEQHTTNYPVHPKAEKLPQGIQLDINKADTSEFKKIPGIGSAYANRILKYRQRLGGFYSVQQIREVYGITDEVFSQVSQWMKIERDSLEKILVNKVSLEQLKSHPYINFYQAKAITEWRKRHGKLTDLSELQLLEEFSEEDLDRLGHYLSME